MSRKPQSLPKNWPNSKKEDIDEKPQRIVIVGGDQEYTFRGNSVKTSKYEWWNFLPKFLMEQFDPRTKLANCYFLTIAGLQTIPMISNTQGYPTVLVPLTGVLVAAGVLTYLEDRERHRADKAANSSFSDVFDPKSKTFVKKLWSDIVVGDYVRVKSREVVPADILIVDAWEPNLDSPKGACFVETKSLDGETNLKHRSVLSALVGKACNNDALFSLRGKITMEHPNNLIDKFTGVFENPQFGRVPIQAVNIALRGCVLRSTEYMVGLTLNTGHDVKIMQSKSKARVKTSNLESAATSQIVRIIILLLAFCLCGAIGRVVFSAIHEEKDVWYMKGTDQNLGKIFIVQFFYLLLLHATFVPVALYVSMAFVRFLQSKFLQFDLSMYYEPLDWPALVRTMTLNEELGQISHIFSDKTGTLTCNIMNFRKASINGLSYGKGITEIGRAAWKLMGKDIPADTLEAERLANENSVPHVAFYCPDFDRNIWEAKKGTNKAHIYQRNKVKEFYRFIAVCHEVIAERLEGGGTKLSAPNPDDEALVCAAAYFGYEFRDRRDKFIILFDKEADKVIEIEVLYTIPFSSARKRMSVIIRDVDQRVKIITKGADSMMFSRVDPEDDILESTSSHINQYSMEGLRCLVVAAADIDGERFNKWSKHYDEASTDMAELEKKKNGEVNDIDTLEDFIEKGLHVIGATAIEDRLQDGVADCIEKLTQAGIKIWVLTGDKEETAINIAVACNLVLPKEYMDQVVINNSTAPDLKEVADILKKELIRYKTELVSSQDSASKTALAPSSDDQSQLKASSSRAASKTTGDKQLKKTEMSYSKLSLSDLGPLPALSKPRALIIDGPSLIPIMNDPETRKLLLLFSQCCQAVVCCRVSPDQKREVVDLVKKNVPGIRTLAVGDGANDVAMINAADVGVGIKGEEGVQAVNASDFAIAQFRFLAPLLLKHGRFNYIRMSNLICYMFYKNIFMSTGIFWYNFFNAASGLKYYSEIGIQFFNVIYTAVPIIAYACYDQDVSGSISLKYPELYRAGKDNRVFTNKIFWSWIGNAFVDSIFCGVLTHYILNHFDYETGGVSTYLQPGCTIFTAVVIICNLKIFLFQARWYRSSFFIMFLSIAFWFLLAYADNILIEVDYNFYSVWTRILRSGAFWMIILLLVVAINIKDIFFSALRRQWFFSPVDILQEIQSLDSEETGSNRNIPAKVAE